MRRTDRSPAPATGRDQLRSGRSLGLLIALSFALCGCLRLGPTQLSEDTLGYSRSLSDAEKRQTLLNVVRLRYADLPTFLDATQVIAGHQLQRSVTGGFEVFPNAPISTYLSGTGSAQLQDSPTFTLQPVTGEHFAESFLRPLSPTDLLPLMQGGLPVDVLFRLAVQSAGALHNSVGLEQNGGEGSPQFFTLIRDLRRLQIAGLIGIKFEQGKKAGPDGKPVAGPEHIYFTIAPATGPDLAGVENEVCLLLNIPPHTAEIEVVYGRTATSARQLPILTRSMLGVLAQLAFQAEVPAEDVERHRTVASVPQVAAESRPVVIIHSARTKPADAFTAVEYHGAWFWLDDGDFDSKVAFSIVNVLLSLAKTSSAPGTVITIPAG